MLATIYSGGVQGIDGYIVEVEGNVSSGLPTFEIVGLPDAAVKESKERVRAAIESLGLEFPMRRVTINLAPGNIKKEGPGFDLPIAISILAASEQLKAQQLADYLFLGELSLGGELRPISGVLPMVLSAARSGIRNIILPRANAREAAILQDVKVYGADTLHDVICHLAGQLPMQPETLDLQEVFRQDNLYQYDFSEVKGQLEVKRALEIAAAGGHNSIMIGTPGSGKTMLAARVPSILPDMTLEEALDVTKIHSIAGLLPADTALVTRRPFRAPHHTVSTISLVGGGRFPRPGEVSLAHHGVLFLDELPEFRKDALEILRQPLEDRQVSISRVSASITYPCDFMLVAAMNPCHCGYFGDPSRRCTCSETQIQRYRGKISGPLMDRVDLHINVMPVEYAQLADTGSAECSASIRARVNHAREVQRKRYQSIGVACNANLTTSQLKTYCPLDSAASHLLEQAFHTLGLSARAYTRIIKVARTIADLEDAAEISVSHIAEAIQYRSLDRKRPY